MFEMFRFFLRTVDTMQHINCSINSTQHKTAPLDVEKIRSFTDCKIPIHLCESGNHFVKNLSLQNIQLLYFRQASPKYFPVPY